VGAGQAACAVCGAALATGQQRSAASRSGYDRETMRFARAVLSRPYIFTITFLVANLFVFLLMWHSSGMSMNALWGFPQNVLFAYGAKLDVTIKEGHQWWRFVTPMFLHVNLLHILVNMYSLWMVGPYVEKLYGSARFVVFWVVSGIGGVVASYLTVVQPGSPLSGLRFIFKTQDGLSAGASGALFGLVGVLFVFGIKFRSELPEGFKRAFGTGLLPVIAINLFIGYLGSQYIDNAAHLGGLASGAALAAVVSYRRPGERSGMTLTWQVLQVAALLLVAVSFVKVAQHFHESDPIPVMQPAERPDQQTAFFKTMSDGQEALQNALQGDQSVLETAVTQLESADPPDFKADQLKRELIGLLKAAKQTSTPAASPLPKAKATPDPRNKLKLDYKSWKAEYDQWLKSRSATP
jgi:membrane associated rhomboid family serine protease